jgi:peptide/nickel transport system ATP-binding protein
MSVVSFADLGVTYRVAKRDVVAVDGVTFEVEDGECVALVGESGSGKSTIATVALGMWPRSARVRGRATVAGVDVVRATEPARRSLRGRAVTYVPQDTGAAFDPVVPVVDQVGELLRVHDRRSRRDARDAAAALLASVGVDARVAADRLLPDELSGGMRQRALFATAMSRGTRLVVADEPTSSLDPETALGLLERLQEVRAASGCALLFVTHQLGVARAIADRVVVLHDGRVVEDGPADRVLTAPDHEHTQQLLAASPSLAALGVAPGGDGHE